jgi:hypothetical protein
MKPSTRLSLPAAKRGFELDVPPVHVAELGHLLQERAKIRRVGRACPDRNKANDRLRGLGCRCERTRRCSAEQRDELAPS